MSTATHEDSDGTGYCRGCGTTIGESHHVDCDLLEMTDEASPVQGNVNLPCPFCEGRERGILREASLSTDGLEGNGT